MPSENLDSGTFEQFGRGQISDFHAIQVLARRLPKAELHMHFLGSIGRSFPFPTEDARAASVGDLVDVADSFDRLRRVARCLTSPTMFEEATLNILMEHITLGCRHVEMFVVPDEIALSPVPVPDALHAIGRAFDQMKRQYGLTGGIIIDIDRNVGPKMGMAVVELAMSARDAGVPIPGIGSEGPFEEPVSLVAFAPVNEFAKKQGFHVTSHLASLQDVIDGLELNLERADHAWDLKGRPELMAKYREAGISITSTPGAVAFHWPGRMPSPFDHPADEFRRNGIKTCIGTDVPAFVQTDIAQEYVLAQQSYGWTRREMFEIAMNSLEMAWIDGNDRDARLAAWRAEGESLLEDPRKSNATTLSR